MTFSVVVPWRTDNGYRQELWDWNRTRWEGLFPDAEIIAIDSGDAEFHRGKSRNLGVAQASNDVIVLADADTAFQPDAISDAAVLASRGEWVVAYGEDRYYNLNETSTKALLKVDPTADMVEPIGGTWDHKLLSWAGLIVLHRNAFKAVGGYDDRFIGWGWEDNDFRLALDTLWSPHVRVSSWATHLWHPVAENEAFGQPMIEHNRQLHLQYQKAYGNPARMRQVISA